MTKNELKDLIKECLQEAATPENFITFRISGGYNFKTKPNSDEAKTTSLLKKEINWI